MAPKKRKTRQSNQVAFCAPAELPVTNQLYTNKDILASVLMDLEQNPEVEVRDSAKKIEPVVRNKWLEVNPLLVLFQTKSIINKIVKLHDTAKQINRKNITSKKKDNFMGNIDKLFDILLCQCPILSCEQQVCDPPCDIPHIQCLCSRDSKIPVIELAFIQDQRNKVGSHGGKMVMGAVDKVVAKQQEANRKKKASALLQTKKYNEEMESNNTARYAPEVLEEIANDQDENEEDFSAPLSGQKEKEITTTDLRFYVAECVRY